MTDAQIDEERLAGDILLVLRTGTEEQRQSLLRVIAKVAPDEWKIISDWVREGMPGA